MLRGRNRSFRLVPDVSAAVLVFGEVQRSLRDSRCHSQDGPIADRARRCPVMARRSLRDEADVSPSTQYSSRGFVRNTACAEELRGVPRPASKLTSLPIPKKEKNNNPLRKIKQKNTFYNESDVH